MLIRHKLRQKRTASLGLTRKAQPMGKENNLTNGASGLPIHFSLLIDGKRKEGGGFTIEPVRSGITESRVARLVFNKRS